MAQAAKDFASGSNSATSSTCALRVQSLFIAGQKYMAYRDLPALKMIIFLFDY